jgi:hypothetical protein
LFGYFREELGNGRGKDKTRCRQRLGEEEFGIIVYLISNKSKHTQILSAE